MSVQIAPVIVSPPSSPARPSFLLSDTHARPKVLGAVPVVRRAILLKHSPALRDRQTHEAARLLKEAWPVWRDQYVATIAAIFDVDPADIFVAGYESVRHRYDGKTPMIDLPRVRTRPGVESAFDLRNCIALCTDHFSSKVWTRVGPPEGSVGVTPSHLRALTNSYRNQVVAAGEWFYDQFLKIAKTAFKGARRSRNDAGLEVTTVGLRVHDGLMAEELESWLFDGDTANMSNTDLRAFLAAAANIDFDIAGLADREPDAYWVSVPGAVQAVDGTLASRRVLYVIRTVRDGVQAVGIGLDDSGRGDLANDIALKFSRQIANSI